jgi:hypothetical protein
MSEKPLLSKGPGSQENLEEAAAKEKLNHSSTSNESLDIHGHMHESQLDKKELLIIKVIFFMYGNAILLPWSSKLSALDFIEERLPGTNISFYISFLSHFFLPTTMFGVILWGYKWTYFTRIHIMILT